LGKEEAFYIPPKRKWRATGHLKGDTRADETARGEEAVFFLKGPCAPEKRCRVDEVGGVLGEEKRNFYCGKRRDMFLMGAVKKKNTLS